MLRSIVIVFRHGLRHFQETLTRLAHQTSKFEQLKCTGDVREDTRWENKYWDCLDSDGVCGVPGSYFVGLCAALHSKHCLRQCRCSCVCVKPALTPLIQKSISELFGYIELLWKTITNPHCFVFRRWVTEPLGLYRVRKNIKLYERIV